MPPRRFAASFLLLPYLLASLPAPAQSCDGVLSPCFDANNLDIALGPGQFASLEDAGTQLSPGQISAGLAMSYLRNPVVMTSPSPDPEGRSVPLVGHVWQTDLLLSVGVLDTLQVALGLPFRLYQFGGGIEAVTARSGDTLSSTVLVDPRLGVGWQAFRGPITGRAGLEVKLPLGAQGSFAGAPGPTWIPTFSVASSQWGPWHVAAEAGARFRQTTQIGDVRIGHQLSFAAGARYSIVRELSVGVEAWVLPSLVEQPQTPYGRARHLPAEWLLSLASPVTEKLWLQAGAGSGLPLSRQGSEPDGSARESLLGVTTPSWRAVVQARFTE